MPAMIAAPSTVKVRMYRQGLGDCFLLAFGAADGHSQTYMVIDCGVFYGTPGGAKTMTSVAEDIRASTNGRVDILVITHEHYDHLSGFRFAQARKIWDTIDIGQVWAAWTEDPDHPLGKKLKGSRAFQEAALRVAAARLRAAGNIGASEHIDSLLGFSQGVREDLEYVLGRVNQPKFFSPGDQKKSTKFLGTTGFRCFVLGPPDDEDTKLLRRSDPSTSNSEVYEETQRASASFATSSGNIFAATILADANPKQWDGLLAGAIVSAQGITGFARPFDAQYDVSIAKAKKSPFFRTHYGFANRKSHGDKWRRIDGDWLSAAATLAMQLDNAINNTSLALAFEIESSGKVLLFPGDAQVGNMLSWHQHRWKINGAQVTVEDLLNRTSFYKVGHHGSHNATLKEQGLEMMQGDDFTAVIPVSKAMAAKQGKKLANGKPAGWKMPYGPLLANWNAFTKRVRQKRLYVEIEVG